MCVQIQTSWKYNFANLIGNCFILKIYAITIINIPLPCAIFVSRILILFQRKIICIEQKHVMIL